MRFTQKSKLLCVGLTIVSLMIAAPIIVKAVEPAAAASLSSSDTEEKNSQKPEFTLPEDAEQQFAEYGLEYFAYMDLDSSAPALHPLILEARSRIIYGSTGWVADGHDAYIKDKDGNILEVLPHFHDLFPEDWELPLRYVNEGT